MLLSGRMQTPPSSKPRPNLARSIPLHPLRSLAKSSKSDALCYQRQGLLAWRLVRANIQKRNVCVALHLRAVRPGHALAERKRGRTLHDEQPIPDRDFRNRASRDRIASERSIDRLATKQLYSRRDGSRR